MSERFSITCLECGSKNVSVEDSVDYDWEETPYISGCYLQCNDCGNMQNL